ncbi:alpha/beta hydrolase [Sphingomonas sp. ABOLD]|uniref:Pimeloyl-ACP methyl ester carboxylesterase n=1 Tax=Sphingomonas trueperi TaxID=53317 RepID=A0A7X5Y1K5_9SPHN|nr:MULTISPECIES: alpha/beta hydrolase [Sphingomonas]NJB99383.1 pimeloyl-ACP methyl ester carboxylesterase [Sphingomonas trueperi]RSV36745.1 alpha/beta hydrolase [Sphingomonas sp. ABOLD]
MQRPSEHLETSVHRIEAAGVSIFYRAAGDPRNPVILLLHGFPSSSHQFRAFMPRLADRFHVIAPDLPGFGFTEVPDDFVYSFDSLAETIGAFCDVLGLRQYALYLFDYGAPVGFRLAPQRPDAIRAIVSQNGNAYEEGMSEGWAPTRAYWADPSPANRDAMRSMFTLETTRWQYTHGAPDPARVAPEGYWLDAALLARPGQDQIQLDLIADYARNVALYPRIHTYLRERQPPLLAVWGANDPFFLPAGAKAFRRDLPEAEVHLLDAGHFALETHAGVIADHMCDFLQRHLR